MIDRREYNRLYLREWRKRNREKMRLYDQRWRAANPVTAKESDRKKNHKHYEKVKNDPSFQTRNREHARKWVEENPTRHRENSKKVQHRRRARKYEATIGPINFQEILKSSNGLCGICREPLTDKVEYDHIVPLSKGGTHSQDNLQVTHPLCNRRKSDRIIEGI